MAVLLSFQDKRCDDCGRGDCPHAVKREYRCCYASMSRRPDIQLGDVDVGYGHMSHAVEVARGTTEQDLFDIGWRRYGRLWVCPECRNDGAAEEPA